MVRKKRRSKQFRDSSKVIDMQQARDERQKQRQEREPAEDKLEQVSTPSDARTNMRKMKLRRRKQNRRRIIAAAVAFFMIIFSVSAGRILLLKHELYQAEKQQVVYQQEKQQLEKDMEELDDLDYLEEQARDQMRLVKPGETLYIFPEEMTER